MTDENHPSFSEAEFASESTDAIRILCVDDHRLVREGIVALISGQPDMRVVATAATGQQAIALFGRYRPDITLMDLQLAGMSGLDAVKAIHEEDHDARIIMLTMHSGEEDIYRALAAGVSTYLLKDTVSADLIRVIREVHGGQRPLGRDIQARLAQRASHRTLTSREVQIVELIAQGLRNKEIGNVLAISEETVSVHMRNIFAKLGVKDRTAVLAVAVKRGLIHLGSEEL
jgi:DNA-binding NarL/FixJ family response regulator